MKGCTAQRVWLHNAPLYISDESEYAGKRIRRPSEGCRSESGFRGGNFTSMEMKMSFDFPESILRNNKLFKTLKNAGKEIKEEVAVIRERDPAATSDLEVMLLYSGFHALMAHKLSHRLYLKKRYFAARLVSQTARFLTGIEIHPGAVIGRGMFIDHGSGVVIGETAEIGDNCTIYQGVTLGGTGKDTGKRHPTLGNNVMIGAGAKVLGPFKIGDNAKIAANAVVLEEIPPDSTAVGIPARVVRHKNQKVGSQSCIANRNMDQIHIPDPVSQELCRMQMQLDKMMQELEVLRNESGRRGQEDFGKPMKRSGESSAAGE